MGFSSAITAHVQQVLWRLAAITCSMWSVGVSRMPCNGVFSLAVDWHQTFGGYSGAYTPGKRRIAANAAGMHLVRQLV
jgi:hypothetical protein